MADTFSLASGLMLGFAADTGLSPPTDRPARYLWTDAFAVCNYLGLFRETGDIAFRHLALRLVDQVHLILGHHRSDDARKGWISGLSDEEGKRHPTAGGLRIGKQLPERRPAEPFNERLEWDRDGQYYHYLTKWMHALSRASRVTGDLKYITWAIELAKEAHTRFTYAPPFGSRKRMYWKMNIDLSRPLVASMGQHDPLDGLVTYHELQVTAEGFSRLPEHSDLSAEIAEMAGICRGLGLATDDPLGIGGLLFDANRIGQMVVGGRPGLPELLETVVDAALLGVESFASGRTVELPAEYRLAFRELGLAIGLKGVDPLRTAIGEQPDLFGGTGSLRGNVEALARYLPLGREIERFWTDPGNREAASWKEHIEINRVMLATSLAPAGFLGV